ncbi:MAG: peptidoglycan DD-metalloendopeptidase family protein, partial [Candidatus Latescibacteria bacterium]|nr:peptidoglycan DD-metalloendopeptidase family protein [Candidatus Latescibacterota bacterium]
RFTFHALRFTLYASRTHPPSPSPSLMPMTHAIPSSRTIQTALLSLLLLLTGSSLLCAQSEDLTETIEAEKKKLERMKKDQEQYVGRVEALKKKGGRISTEMDQLDRKVHTTQRALRKIRTEEKRLKKNVSSTHQSLDETQKNLVQRRHLFSKRLRTMYKRGRLNALELLVSAQNFPDFYKRWKGLTLVAQWDRNQLAQIRKDSAQLLGQKDRLEQSHRAQLELRQRKSEEENRLKKQKRQKKQALGRIKKDVTRFNTLAEQQAQDIAESQTAITHYIEELERRRQEALKRKGRIAGDLPFEDMEKSKGKLLWPMRGKVITRFGRHNDPQLKTWTFNRGIDIRAKEGSEIRAAAPGLVVLSDWYRGYGRFLLIDHGLGYFTLYAHLSETFPKLGDFVQTGDPIATSGKSGLNDTPKFHFEILKGKEPLDPMKWLRK